jgi:SCY1-like protein 2
VSPWTGRRSKSGQPDLDYVAPEIQLERVRYTTTASDMFSFGSLVCAMFAGGRPPIQAAYNTATYAKLAHLVRVKLRRLYVL